MNYLFEIVSVVANVVMGGGLIITLATLRQTQAKASHEAKRAELENEQKAAQIAYEFIVEPLKKEMNALRKNTRRLVRAIEKISGCPHIDSCPVRRELRGSEELHTEE